MVLVNDFNREINGLLKSKYPNDSKLLELNISSLSKNPTHNYSITTLGNADNVLKNGLTTNKSNENLLLMDGNSTFKWDLLSTQIETKMDMNGLTVFEAKTKPRCGFSLNTKYEKNLRSSGLAGSVLSGSIINNSGTIEVGGDLQNSNFHTRLRLYPSIEMLGCVNKLNKEKSNKGTGINISSTVTSSKLISPNSLSFGVMMTNNEISFNSMKITLGLLLKGPLFGRLRRIENERNRQDYFYRSEKNRLLFNNSSDADNNTCQSSYSVSLQTNTSNVNSNFLSNSNKISGFTGGICLSNLMNGFLTLGASLTYNTRQELEMTNDCNNNVNGGVIISSSNDRVVENEASNINSSSPRSSLSNLSQSPSCLLSSSPFLLSRSALSRVQYTVGAKISFGKMKSINSNEEIDKVNCYFDDGSASQLNNQVTKSTDIKFRFSNNMNMSYSLTHRFNKYISTTFGANIDLNSVNIVNIINNNNSDSIKYGFSLDLTV
ncbi:hypothetical protein FG386_001806 [Cryptosporidium ryanae]|uniref:uncharacterized protein n=1 Tax=Cryptosporidium ryanae TaxID=515981 RepID=UPI00351A88C4|nr:hypothetical protein FG386_001806 [Cryptosporidium ryanae]